jgi:hypothetical protein
MTHRPAASVVATVPPPGVPSMGMKVTTACRPSPHLSHPTRRACRRREQGAHESLTCPGMAADVPLAGLAFVTIDGVWSATHSC